MDQHPLTTGSDRPLTEGLAVFGIIYPLYAKSLWPRLRDALQSALVDKNGALFLCAGGGTPGTWVKLTVTPA